MELIGGSSVLENEKEVASAVAGQVEAAACVKELRALLVASGLESWELPMMVGKVDRLNQPIAVVGFVPAGTVRRVSAVLRAGLVARRRPPATGS